MKHRESEIQRCCVKWFRLRYSKLARLLFAVPNGGARSATEAKIMKAEGVLAGVSDLLLLYPNNSYHGLCIEMKSEKGRQQDTQKLFQREVEAVGYKYIICRSFDDFKNMIDYYLTDNL